MKLALAYPVSEMAGKAGGDFGIVTFQWRGLQCARRLVVPANPSTTEQDTIRGLLATAATAFQSVTPAEKVAWETFAELMASRIMGQMVVRPAISEYCKINVLRQMNGQVVSDTAPTTKPDFAVTAITELEWDAVNSEINIKLTHNTAVTANKWLLVKYTSALPSQVVVPRKSDYRCAEGVLGAQTIVALAASPQTIVLTAPWSNLTVGEFRGVSLQPLNITYVPGVEFSDVVEVTAE